MENKILKFSASWCEPCKALATVVKQSDFGVNIVDVDIDVDRAVAVQHKIRSVPTMVYLVGGVEVDRLVGSVPEADIRKWISTVNK